MNGSLEDDFSDSKKRLNRTEAELEANRCIHCFDAPCIRACPTAIDIPTFIGRIAAQHPLGAAKTILESNVFGLSCAQACPTEVLCEGACVYVTLKKEPIQIGRLQRFAVESAYSEGANFFKAGEPTRKRVALVGAGPASLACAHELRVLGHETTIFEKTKTVGGLNTSGIAPYKMKSRVSLREIEKVLEIGGIEIRYEQELGRNLSIDSLVKEFDAVFLGIGLGADSTFPGVKPDSKRVRGAVEFIAELKLSSEGKMNWVRSLPSALVVGGGNTALDACRELKGLGIPNVVVSYRRGEGDMSGYRHEFLHAREEGVQFRFHTTPTQFEEKKDSVKVDRTGGPNETESFEAGIVLLAIGQKKQDSFFSAVENPKVFSGGDFANGGKEVVNAVAEGKRAARAIHERMKNG